MSEERDHPKGILKHSDPDEKKDKRFQWDEMNILATYHPADKTYGHMKVDEPPTPYNYEYNASKVGAQAVNPDDLASKLAVASQTPPKMLDDRKHDADAKLTPEEAEHRRQFQEKRKQHYNEFHIAKALRHHCDDDDDDDEDYEDPVAKQNAMLNSQIHPTAPRKNH